MINVGTIRDPNTDEIFADIRDLISLLKDAKEHPENYNKEAVTALANQITGKTPVKPPEPKNPF